MMTILDQIPTSTDQIPTSIDQISTSTDQIPGCRSILDKSRNKYLRFEQWKYSQASKVEKTTPSQKWYTHKVLRLKKTNWKFEGNCKLRLKNIKLRWKKRGWKFRRRRELLLKMRILGWIWNLFLITGVHTIERPNIVIPSLEDIKNKLRASASPGNYGLGQKMSTKQFGEFWNPSRRGMMLVEMGFILISKSTTDLEGIEIIANRNLETAKNLYAGKIECRPTQYGCRSRRKIAMHAGRVCRSPGHNSGSLCYEWTSSSSGCTNAEFRSGQRVGRPQELE